MQDIPLKLCTISSDQIFSSIVWGLCGSDDSQGLRLSLSSVITPRKAQGTTCGAGLNWNWLIQGKSNNLCTISLVYQVLTFY